MRITLGALVAGANTTLSGTYAVQPSANPNYLVSTTGGVKLCGTSTTTSNFAVDGGTATVYSGDPTNGKCVFTGHNFLGKI
jgi:hypothetical protein